ncbi:uncharacterized protein METZ01_LOCUS381664, partial [marine metagenome]
VNAVSQVLPGILCTSERLALPFFLHLESGHRIPHNSKNCLLPEACFLLIEQ